jgi:hypothetical protein
MPAARCKLGWRQGWGIVRGGGTQATLTGAAVCRACRREGVAGRGGVGSDALWRRAAAAPGDVFFRRISVWKNIQNFIMSSRLLHVLNSGSFFNVLIILGQE